MNQLIEKLLSAGTVITDGSWGTQMQRRGLARGECPDSWNLTHPDRVEEVASLYVSSGSTIILTNTFGANRFVLGKLGLADKAVEINRRGVEISKRAAKDRAFVFASMGPSGKLLAMKDVTEAELREAFEEQASTIAEAGADGIVVETMMDLEEAKIASSAARATGLPVVASMVFDAGKNKDRTMMGTTPEQAVEALSAIGVDAIGANCGQGIEGFIPICARMGAMTKLPLWMKPNAGIPEVIDGEIVYKTTAEEFGRFIPDLIKAGASFIGGCCGTDEGYVRAIVKSVSR